MNKPIRKNRYKKNNEKRYKAIKWAIKIVLMTGLIALVIGLQSIVFISGYKMLTDTPYLKANRIEIGGNRFLSDTQIQDLAGISIGTNLFSVNLSLIQKKLMQHPWIFDASVRRDIPDTFIIHVKEHEPLAILDFGKKYLMNKKGQVFKKLDENNLKDLPIIHGLNVSDIHIEKKKSKASIQEIISFLKVVNRVKTILTKYKIEKIIMDEEMGLSIQLTDNLKMIRLGHENYQAKLDRLKQVLALLDHQQDIKDFKTIDINDPNRIVVLPVKSKNPGGKGKEV